MPALSEQISAGHLSPKSREKTPHRQLSSVFCGRQSHKIQIKSNIFLPIYETNEALQQLSSAVCFVTEAGLLGKGKRDSSKDRNSNGAAVRHTANSQLAAFDLLPIRRHRFPAEAPNSSPPPSRATKSGSSKGALIFSAEWKNDSGAEDLGYALSTIGSLTDLNLSDNNLGDSGVKLVSAALSNPVCKIQKLWLENVGLTDSGAEDLVTALSTNPSLTELDLSDNKLGDSGVKLVSVALRRPECKIQKLELREVGLTDSGAEDLVSTLSTNPSLTELNLSGNKLGDSGVKLVSAALRNPECKIKELRLGDVGLTDSGAADLASALSTIRSLTELNLGSNKLGDSGVKLVSAALRDPECKIQKLWLRDVCLTDSGAEDLIAALSTNPPQTELNLEFNSLTDGSVPALHRLILTLPRLKLIELGGNRFSVTGRKELGSLRESRPGLTVAV
ncbi:NACHT, LRR and PYD domains-containing protein 3-like [Hemitrygon akajei]|uniref:NACHT, LRR and PYD domains-containing protein 3-like n=1 Tax=Hemitrygon akajei TaxID=2704970 RepID=UPI003BF9F733